jgi:sensor histidine kinase YesM
MVFSEQTKFTFEELNEIRTIPELTFRMYSDVKNFYTKPDKNFVSDFNKTYDSIDGIITQMKETNPNSFVTRDLQAMLKTFQENGLDLFEQISNLKQPIFYYRSDLTSYERLQTYITDQTYIVIDEILSNAKQASAQNVSLTQKQILFIIILTFIVTITCVFFAYRVSRKIADPIHSLSQKLQQIAQRDLTVRESENKSTDDEVHILIESFNDMVEKMNLYVEEIKKKSAIENQLQKEKLRNTEMENLLHLSELKYLQMQINPHFLYNTFNTISALAQIENASETQTMIERLSILLRYNLSAIDKTISLWDEKQIVESYLYIQKARFKERLSYDIKMSVSTIDTIVPSMILQPIVENAIIHGLEPKPEGGEVTIQAIDLQNETLIVIEDNGIGMTRESIDNLLASSPEDHDSRRGVGIKNVQQRLEIIFKKNVMEITSIPGKGTTVKIHIPKGILSEKKHYQEPLICQKRKITSEVFIPITKQNLKL